MFRPAKTATRLGFKRLGATAALIILAGLTSGAGSAVAFYPPPVPSALGATEVTQFTATLHATLQTGEAIVNYHFEYGASTAYGTIAPVPDGYTQITTETVPVSQPIGNLQAGTTYHYRLLASSPGATNVPSPDATFTTLPIPAPTVATGAASSVGVGSVTLSGSIDPHAWDTTYLFQYGTSTVYGQSWPTVPVDLGALPGAQPVLVSLERLQPSTAYHYRLLATNGGGTEYGADQTFTTTEYPLSVIQQAPPLTPAVAFPKEEANTNTATTTKAPKCKKGLVKRHNKCAKSKAKKKGKKKK
jgi:hypothetical protein